MERLNQQIAFIREIEKLKTVKRQNLTLDNGRFENSAEHSWHISVMAMVLMEDSGLEIMDQYRVIQMLLIHDLVEIYAGDAFLYDESARQAAAKKEGAALEKLMALLPEDQGERFRKLWLEFEECTTQASRFAKALDGFQPVLNHQMTAPDGRNPYGLTVTQVLKKKQFITDYAPTLWPKVLEAVEDCVSRGIYIDDRPDM